MKTETQDPPSSRPDVRDKAVAGAKATAAAVHEHPYKAIAIGVGVGAIFGFLLARRCSRRCD